jgi:hypothetical protein
MTTSILTAPDSNRADSSLSCDFCGQPASVLYRARPVAHRVANLTVTWARTSWRACDSCRKLIASGRRDELVKRALAAGPTTNRHERRALRSSMRRLHDHFWSARTHAEPVPLEEALAAAQPGLYAVTLEGGAPWVC